MKPGNTYITDVPTGLPNAVSVAAPLLVLDRLEIEPHGSGVELPLATRLFQHQRGVGCLITEIGGHVHLSHADGVLRIVAQDANVRDRRLLDLLLEDLVGEQLLGRGLIRTVTQRGLGVAVGERLKVALHGRARRVARSATATADQHECDHHDDHQKHGCAGDERDDECLVALSARLLESGELRIELRWTDLRRLARLRPTLLPGCTPAGQLLPTPLLLRGRRLIGGCLG